MYVYTYTRRRLATKFPIPITVSFAEFRPKNGRCNCMGLFTEILTIKCCINLIFCTTKEATDVFKIKYGNYVCRKGHTLPISRALKYVAKVSDLNDISFYMLPSIGFTFRDIRKKLQFIFVNRCFFI